MTKEPRKIFIGRGKQRALILYKPKEIADTHLMREDELEFHGNVD